MIQKEESNNRVNNLVINSVKYEVREDPFVVPILFKKEVPLNKTIFELNEPLPKNYGKELDKQLVEEEQMHDPLLMDSASLKLLEVEKMKAYLSAFSIFASLYELYWLPPDQDGQAREWIRALGLGLTFLLLVIICVGAYFHFENNLVRRRNDPLLLLKLLGAMLVVVLAPNPWPSLSYTFLHLTLLLRLYFPLNYSILSSMYCDPRAARITNLYGIKPEVLFRFACKVIVNQKSIVDVLMIYLTIVVFYSHCLFIVSADSNFIQCFEVVIATLPTIGFGEYAVEGTPRLVILCVMVTGVQLNAFVTFVVLQHFEMTTSETNSFILMEKLRVVEELESISSNFIIRKVKGRRGRLNFL
jgi:hypothetical protein